MDPSYPKLCLWINSIGDHSLVAKVLIRATWREKTQLWLYADSDAQLKGLDFSLWFNWKRGNHEQAGVAEVTWPRRRKSPNSCFCHLPSHPGCRRRPICFKSSTSKKTAQKRHARLSPRRDDLSANADERGPGSVHREGISHPNVIRFRQL